MNFHELSLIFKALAVDLVLESHGLLAHGLMDVKQALAVVLSAENA